MCVCGIFFTLIVRAGPPVSCHCTATAGNENDKHGWHSWFATALLAALLVVADAAYGQAQAVRSDKPYRIFAITYPRDDRHRKGLPGVFQVPQDPR